MASQGPLYPSIVAQTNLGNFARRTWDDPTLVKVSDNLRATLNADPAPGSTTLILSNKVICKGFGFTIPLGSRIDGFVVSFEGGWSPRVSINPQCHDGVIELIYGAAPVGGPGGTTGDTGDPGTVVGQNNAQASWAASIDSNRSIGGSTDLWSWTSATWNKVNDETFGLRFECYATEGILAVIDSLALTVYYTAQTAAAFTWTGGLGIGGSFPRKVGDKQAFSGGVGIGYTGWKRGIHPVASQGGVGIGNAAWVRKIGAVRVWSGGVGIGENQQKVGEKLAMQGGVGVGGEFVPRIGWNYAMLGGVGIGNTEPTVMGVKYQMTGGLGIGGSVEGQRGVYHTIGGGIGLGYPAWQGISGKAFVMDGGLGIGNAAWARTDGHKNVMTGGIGLGGGFRSHGKLGGGSTDWGIDRDRTHRGAVTRWELLTAIKADVESVLGSTRVYIATEEPDMNNVPPDDTFAVLMLGASKDDQPALAGGGLNSTLRREMLQIRVYSGLSTDQVPRSTAWTLRQDKGAVERARAIRKRLHMRDVMDAAGWLILAEPMRSLNTGDPKQKRSTPQWGYFPEMFECYYSEYLG